MLAGNQCGNSDRAPSLLPLLVLLAACDGNSNPATQGEPAALDQLSTELSGRRGISVCPQDCDYAEIQLAVDAASSGEVVRVLRGTYAGPIVVAEKSITIKGEGPNTTIVSGGAPVLKVVCSAPADIKVAGVTITNGGGPAGGVVNEGCALVLRDAAVTNNAVHASGGGIRNSEGTLVLSDVRIANNLGRVGGGGLYNAPGAAVRVRDSSFIDNTAGIGLGAGIANEGDLVLRDSVVTRNSGKFGGGLSNLGTAAIHDSNLLDNTALISGGGIYNGGTLAIEGSRIARNRADNSGGGLFNLEGATVSFEDTSIRANLPDNCTGIACP